MSPFFFYLVATSIRASFHKRIAFLVESTFMMLSNMIFFFIWWIFFHQFQEVGGWTLREMAALMAIGLGGYGLMQIGLGGGRFLARMIRNGELDCFLTKPKNVLLHILGSTSFTKGWGNLATSFILIVLGGWTDGFSLLILGFSLISSCIIFTSVMVIAQSSAFWMGALESVAKKYTDSLFIFTAYPTHIYSGLLQFLMFTLIPAGIITYLPVVMLKEFSWQTVRILIFSDVFALYLAFFIFESGLKRYQSGNQIGARG